MPCDFTPLILDVVSESKPSPFHEACNPLSPPFAADSIDLTSVVMKKHSSSVSPASPVSRPSLSGVLSPRPSSQETLIEGALFSADADSTDPVPFSDTPVNSSQETLIQGALLSVPVDSTDLVPSSDAPASPVSVKPLSHYLVPPLTEHFYEEALLEGLETEDLYRMVVADTLSPWSDVEFGAEPETEGWTAVQETEPTPVTKPTITSMIMMRTLLPDFFNLPTDETPSVSKI
ncbi:uncharacterized protein LOC131026104 [Salvia miltiorrhiza]|uniref:uncharacterized protein LOC131026104 n=1 Tax=Salvia miltiorrhiza TaxID=226208 RepID=UPI0025ACB5BB|nr:uncharacterized protein LOC131026104 [Salvia miltiorrhiza]